MDLPAKFRPLVPPWRSHGCLALGEAHASEGGRQEEVYFSTSGFNHTCFQVTYIMAAFQKAYPLHGHFLSTSHTISMLSWKAARRSIVRQKSHLLSSSRTLSLMTPLPWTNSGLPAVPAGNVTFLSHLKEHIGLHMSEDSICF